MSIELELGLALDRQTYPNHYHEVWAERTEEAQITASGMFIRGWGREITRIDEMSREATGVPLPTGDSPVEAYLSYQGGIRGPLLDYMERVKENCDFDTAGAVWKAIREKEAAGQVAIGDRSHFAPPAKYTLVSWLLDYAEQNPDANYWDQGWGVEGYRLWRKQH